MTAKFMKLLTAGLSIVVIAGFLVTPAPVRSQDKDKLQLDKIPKRVMQTLETTFPKAAIQKWTMEKENGAVVYDIEFTQEGVKFGADILENGTISNWEMAIPSEELPEPARDAVAAKYPGVVWKEIMQVTNVKDGKDVLEGYEILLQTADNKEVEVTVSPDGKILEDSSEEKPEGKS
jgi:uncharacterized membrane protein YkoI